MKVKVIFTYLYTYFLKYTEQSRSFSKLQVEILGAGDGWGAARDFTALAAECSNFIVRKNSKPSYRDPAGISEIKNSNRALGASKLWLMHSYSSMVAAGTWQPCGPPDIQGASSVWTVHCAPPNHATGLHGGPQTLGSNCPGQRHFAPHAPQPRVTNPPKEEPTFLDFTV